MRLPLHPWHDISVPSNVEGTIPAFIEIPKGSRVKYELDKKTGLLLVDRVLFSAVYYPANYGFIPRTFCDDGDPLDILVLGQETVQGGVMMRARAIGVMRMRDDKGEDDKIIAVHVDDPEYSTYEDISELPPHRLRELTRFFQDYKVLEHKRVVVHQPQGRKAAIPILEAAVALYQREREHLVEVYSGEAPPMPDGHRRKQPTRRRRQGRA